MVNPVGFRFRPTKEELVDYYLRLKNLESSMTSDVDEVVNTVDICNFEPWDLPCKSIIKSSDQVWYFFSRKKYKYKRGGRQSRTTDSGFWKITGKPEKIMRNRKEIGEKCVLVFSSKNKNQSKSDWVMHEYHGLDQKMPYTICKLMYKGQIEHMNNSPYEGSSSLEKMNKAFEDALSDKWKGLLDDDNDDEQSNIVPMQEDRNDYKPQKSLTGVCVGYDSDDSDYDSISTNTITTSSIVTSNTTCDSFGSSSHHRVDLINDLQEPPNLKTIKLVSISQKVNQDFGQKTEIGEYKLGQEMIKKKKAGFFYKMIQKFTK